MNSIRALFIVSNSTLIAGCVIYDTERGVFVSSSPQVVSVKASSSLEAPINLLPFSVPLSSPVEEELRIAVVGGAFIPISFQYGFDEVDRGNLRRSLVASFGSDPRSLVDVAPGTDREALKGTLVSILFRRAGVNSGAFTTTCTIDSVVSVTRGNKTASVPLVVEGTSGISMASAKNDAIRKYTTGLAGILNGQ
jgi:hypothetical protein